MHPSMSCAEMIASLRANRRAAQDARATAGCASYVAATAPKSSDASSSSSSSRRRARDLDYDPDCPAHNKRQRVRAPQSIALRALQQQSVFHHVMTFAMPSSSLSRTCRDLVLADERLLVQQSDKLISILARFLARWTAPTTGEAANLPLCPHLSFEQLLRASFPIDALMSARVSPHLAHPSSEERGRPPAYFKDVPSTAKPGFPASTNPCISCRQHWPQTVAASDNSGISSVAVPYRALRRYTGTVTCVDPSRVCCAGVMNTASKYLCTCHPGSIFSGFEWASEPHNSSVCAYTNQRAPVSARHVRILEMAAARHCYGSKALEGLESVGKDFRHLMSKALTVKFGTGYSYSRSSALARESLGTALMYILVTRPYIGADLVHGNFGDLMAVLGSALLAGGRFAALLVLASMVIGIWTGAGNGGISPFQERYALIVTLREIRGETCAFPLSRLEHGTPSESSVDVLRVLARRHGWM